MLIVNAHFAGGENGRVTGTTFAIARNGVSVQPNQRQLQICAQAQVWRTSSDAEDDPSIVAAE